MRINPLTCATLAATALLSLSCGRSTSGEQQSSASAAKPSAEASTKAAASTEQKTENAELIGEWTEIMDNNSVTFSFNNDGTGVMRTDTRENTNGKVFEISFLLKYKYTVRDNDLTLNLDYSTVDYDIYMSGAPSQEMNMIKSELDAAYKSPEGRQALKEEMGENKQLRIKSITADVLVLTDLTNGQDETLTRVE